jgi:hypothetical protein
MTERMSASQMMKRIEENARANAVILHIAQATGMEIPKHVESHARLVTLLFIVGAGLVADMEQNNADLDMPRFEHVCDVQGGESGGGVEYLHIFNAAGELSYEITIESFE